MAIHFSLKISQKELMDTHDFNRSYFVLGPKILVPGVVISAGIMSPTM